MKKNLNAENLADLYLHLFQEVYIFNMYPFICVLRLIFTLSKYVLNEFSYLHNSLKPYEQHKQD